MADQRASIDGLSQWQDYYLFLQPDNYRQRLPSFSKELLSHAHGIIFHLGYGMFEFSQKAFEGKRVVGPRGGAGNLLGLREGFQRQEFE